MTGAGEHHGEADRLGAVHFVGIGGAGMSGIARIMLRRGIAVSGSDAKDSAVLAGLRELGGRVHVGHSSEHVRHADTVVVSGAVGEANPELAEARARGLPVLPRAAALATVMAGRRGVAVAGTHGKTTTTSMLTVALRHSGADPAYCIGGQLVTTGRGADEGSGDIFVAEADESDGSFLMLAPHAAVVTNVEADHLDNYASLAAIHRHFDAFVARVTAGGVLVVSADDPGARQAGDTGRRRGLTVRTFGMSDEADVTIADYAPRGLGCRMDIEVDSAMGRAAGRHGLELAVPGRHNALDAAAALTVAVELGFDVGAVLAGLASFTGTQRRLEPRGQAGGVRVFDSYAHHPTELVADLEAARDVAAQLGDGPSGPRRLIAVFQPHLFSRTRYFATELGDALGKADAAVVLDVYGAREEPLPGVTGRLVADAVRLPQGRVAYEPAAAQAPKRAVELAGPGDIVLTLGAGDVTLLAPGILELLAVRGGSA